MPLLRKDGFVSGFSAALGVAVLALMLLGVFFLLRAAAEVIPPFVAAVAVALLLDPVVDRLRKTVTRGKRLPAVALVFLAFLLVFIGLILLVVPHLIDQAQTLAANFPRYVETARDSANHWLLSHRQIAGVPLPANTDEIVARYSAQATAFLKNATSNIATILIGSVSRLLSVVLVPIIAFYLLSDFDRLRARLFFLLPESSRDPIRRVYLDVGTVFGDYIRGLLTVCLAYGLCAILAFLLISLWFPGLRGYALLLGCAAGLLYAVPYVGALVTILLTIVVTLATDGGAAGALTAAGAFLALNQVFDNVVMPRVVGGGVGLHPIISLFALLMGGHLFGLWGMLLSVPIAASIQVVLYRLFPRLALPTPLLYLHGDEVIAERRAAAAAAASASSAASNSAVSASDTLVENVDAEGDSAVE